MLTRLALFAIHRRRAVQAAALLLVIMGAALGTGVFSRLADGGFIQGNAESERAATALASDFGVTTPHLLLLVDGGETPIDDPALADSARQLSERLEAEAGVTQVQSPWTSDSPQLRSADGTSGIITAELADPDGNVEPIIEKYSEDLPNATLTVGGSAAITQAINTQVSEDLAKAETIAFPIILLLLVFVFGGVIAAGIPVIVGVISILGTFLVLLGFTYFTDVSVFSINLVTMLGLGLGIDYSLFVVSRYREELKRGLERHAAIVRSIETAGRTVLFSAIAIAVSLSALLVFPVYFLQSFAYAGVSVVAIAALISIVFLPALLASLGPRIDKWVLIKGRSIENPSPFWARVARLVMRRPAAVALVTTAVLLLLATPLLNVRWGAVDDRVLPPNAPSHLVANALRQNFPLLDRDALTVVALGAADEAAVNEYAARLSQIEDIKRVQTATAVFVDGAPIADPSPQPDLRSGDSYAIRASLGVESASTAGVNAAEAARELNAPFETLVGGFASSQVDSNEPIAENLLPAALLLVAGSFLILFLMTGSVVLPLKAIVMAALSLTAALGAIVWIFQYGNLAEFLNFTPTGSIDHTNVLVMFCIAFGLSMDYEVFLLSRIKEEYDQSGDTSAAVARGLERTGRLITAAALLISVVFLSFATSGIAFIKLIGLGLAISILVDATIVRGLLVPAFMRLMGSVNWWSPPLLRRVHERIGIKEGA